MKMILRICLSLLFIMTAFSCNRTSKQSDMKVIFLHHSVGETLWNGRPPSLLTRAAKKINIKLAKMVSPKPQMQLLFKDYCNVSMKNYLIEEKVFPQVKPYGGGNNPFDYYNIWVYNSGEKPFKGEPTLEILTKEYQVIIFKHCYPVSNIQPERDTADINSPYPSLTNYKLQYLALRDKLHAFPETRFILFTGAAQVKGNISEEEALRSKAFFSWVTEEWDIPNDNIFLWDLYSLQTEGDIYLKDEYAMSSLDSHPNRTFASKAVQLLFNRIIDVIENDGEKSTLTGTKIIPNSDTTR